MSLEYFPCKPGSKVQLLKIHDDDKYPEHELYMVVKDDQSLIERPANDVLTITLRLDDDTFELWTNYWLSRKQSKKSEEEMHITFLELDEVECSYDVKDETSETNSEQEYMHLQINDRWPIRIVSNESEETICELSIPVEIADQIAIKWCEERMKKQTGLMNTKD